MAILHFSQRVYHVERTVFEIWFDVYTRQTRPNWLRDIGGCHNKVLGPYKAKLEPPIYRTVAVF